MKVLMEQIVDVSHVLEQVHLEPFRQGRLILSTKSRRGYRFSFQLVGNMWIVIAWKDNLQPHLLVKPLLWIRLETSALSVPFWRNL